jgi:hypothetical protein
MDLCFTTLGPQGTVSEKERESYELYLVQLRRGGKAGGRLQCILLAQL